MTPISRLMPQDSSSSGSGMRHSEQPPRMTSGQGSGSVPPMNPPAQTRDPMMTPIGTGGNQNGGDIVGDILRDVERGSSIQPAAPYGEPQREVRFEVPPEHSYNQDAEELPQMLRETAEKRHNTLDDDDDDDDDGDSPAEKDSDAGFMGNQFLGMILKETRLPIIVAGLIFLAGLSNADDILGRLIPAIFQSGKGEYAGLILKAVIGGLLFYAVRKIFV